jgi:trk system potassium uptake protein
MKICIIGLGVFGKNLAHRLAALGAEVLAVDRKEENVAAVKDTVEAVAVMDPMDPSALAELPMADMDAVVVAIGDSFEASLLVTAKVQELGAQRVVARVLSPVHGRILKLMKVDRVVVPEEFAARGLAQSMILGDVLDGFDLGDGHSIIEVATPEKLVGTKPAVDPAVFAEHKVTLVTVKRMRAGLLARMLPETQPEGPRILGCPGPELTLQSGDVLVLFGSGRNLRSFLDAHAG